MALIKRNNEPMCGGTIINDQWILTAAHCLERDASPESYEIILAEHNVKKYEGEEVKSNVSMIIIHPRYLKTAKDDYDNDIALMKLGLRLNFTGEHKQLKAINIAWPDMELEEQYCYATGWGTTIDGDASDVLRQVKLQLYNYSYCNGIHKKAFIPESMICAGHEQNDDTCKGDSGGPLQCQIPTEIFDSGWVQMGITSWGEGCGKGGYPGVYTRVASYNKWIREIAFGSSRSNRIIIKKECHSLE